MFHEIAQSCPKLQVSRGDISKTNRHRKLLKTRNLQKILEVSNWVQGLDLNQRPSGYEPNKLPMRILRQSYADDIRPYQTVLDGVKMDSFWTVLLGWKF